MSGSKLKEKLLKIETNRITCAYKNGAIVAIIASIVKNIRSKGYSVIVKHGIVDFNSPRLLDGKRLNMEVLKLEEANSLAMKVEGLACHFGMYKMEDFDGPRFRIKSRISDQLVRRLKKNVCKSCNYILEEKEIDWLQEIYFSQCGLNLKIEDAMYKACIEEASEKGYTVKDHKKHIRNKCINLILNGKDMEWDAIMCHNMGCEDDFDNGVSYAVMGSPSGKFIHVCNKFGEVQQMDRFRFEIVIAQED